MPILSSFRLKSHADTNQGNVFNQRTPDCLSATHSLYNRCYSLSSVLTR